MHVGYQSLNIEDEIQGATIPAIVLYPTATPASPTTFGPYTLDVSMDAPISSGRFPLVVISHGNGGTHLIYRTIGLHLARQGYVVAMIEHPGNNRVDNSLEGSYENLENRPRHVRLTIDALLQRHLEELLRERARALGPAVSVALVAIDNASGEVRATGGC